MLDTNRIECQNLFTPLSNEACLMSAGRSSSKHTVNTEIGQAISENERMATASTTREHQSHLTYHALPTQLPLAISLNPGIYPAHSTAHLDQKASSSAPSVKCSSDVLFSQANIYQSRSIGLDPRKGAGIPTRYLKVSDCPRDMSIWVARDAFKVADKHSATANQPRLRFTNTIAPDMYRATVT